MKIRKSLFKYDPSEDLRSEEAIAIFLNGGARN